VDLHSENSTFRTLNSRLEKKTLPPRFHHGTYGSAFQHTDHHQATSCRTNSSQC